MVDGITEGEAEGSTADEEEEAETEAEDGTTNEEVASIVIVVGSI